VHAEDPQLDFSAAEFGHLRRKIIQSLAENPPNNVAMEIGRRTRRKNRPPPKITAAIAAPDEQKICDVMIPY